MNNKNLKLGIAKTQQGASLIMVLLVMVMVALIGTYAFKQSTTDLSIATSAQVRDVTFRSSDLGVAKFEENVSRSKRLERANGPIGLIRNSRYSDQVELAFCFDASENNFFSPARLSKKLRKFGGHENSFSGGYCNPKSNFTSARGASVDQMWFRRLDRSELTSEAFGDEYVLSKDPLGEHIEGLGVPDAVEYYRLTSTAIVPAFASADASDCMKKSSTASGVDECLKTKGVPYTSEVQNYRLSVQGLQKIN